jgi:pyridinium-3,5-biscarboxylic acid mononucleotide synthase
MKTSVDNQFLRHVLAQVANGSLTSAQAERALAIASDDGVEVAHVEGNSVLDLARASRTGIPEVVLGSHKTVEQIAELMMQLARTGQGALATRVSETKLEILRGLLPDVQVSNVANLCWLAATQITRAGTIGVVCAGTSDLPVAEEAALTAEFLGATVVRLSDVGVAGLGRLLGRLDELRTVDVVLAVAGMEAALPSVLGGLISCPMIAVPTSVGYGVSTGGLAAMISMLASCAPGITVVNIDNGFGAAVAAVRIARLAAAADLRSVASVHVGGKVT